MEMLPFAVAWAACLVGAIMLTARLWSRISKARRRRRLPALEEVLHPDDLAELRRRTVAVLAEHVTPAGLDAAIGALVVSAHRLSRVVDLGSNEVAVVFTDGSHLHLVEVGLYGFEALSSMAASKEACLKEVTSDQAGDLQLTFSSLHRSLTVTVSEASLL
jgi:hypothetical protein